MVLLWAVTWGLFLIQVPLKWDFFMLVAHYEDVSGRTEALPLFLIFWFVPIGASGLLISASLVCASNICGYLQRKFK